MNFFESNETIQSLNAVGENIFVADTNFDIVWVNDYANELIKKIGSYIEVDRKEDLYGRNISEFHRNEAKKQIEIMQNGPFPYSTKINLFNRYRAKIVVNPLELLGNRIGYVLTWKDVTKYEETQAIMEGMYTPIIEMHMDHVLLIPITGVLTEHRIRKMRDKTLQMASEKSAEYVLIDFTGMTEVDEGFVLSEINSLASALRLLGAEVIYTGFSVNLVKMMVHQGLHVNATTFNTVKQAMNYLVGIKNRTD
ncbi:STAS domain-containing protein [Mesobacillus maritimus]|uniref:STAS domain-containing protein n=1 Tax=Mesobacillus maritimus TaxID=1643336 RepID=UPI00384ABDD7